MATSNTIQDQKPTEESPSTPFPQVIRRENSSSPNTKPRIVPWLGHKITLAVDAASASIGVQEPVGTQLRTRIEYRLVQERPIYVHIEELQDLVEDTLIEIGHARVALAYAKYRAKRAAIRQLETAASSGESGAEHPELIGVNQLTDIRARVEFATIGLQMKLSTVELIEHLLKGNSVELNAQERRDTIILNAKSLLDLDADARFFAARILLSYIYEETLEWKVTDGLTRLKEAHQQAFLAYIPQGIQAGRLDPRLQEYELEELSKSIDPFADLQFDFIGIQTLYDRYLIHEHRSDGSKRRLEAPQIFWLRVAMGLALAETTDREQHTASFYNLYKSKRACSSTPTLFNSGTTRPQLSSCYLLYCADSIDAITETWTRFSHLSKWAGGLGCSWTAVRGTGAHIQGTNGESSGIVPFLKVANDIALAVNQGGKRPGALCSYVELWHVDIEDFIELRKEAGDDRRRTHNMNTAHWIPDLFMKRLEQIANGESPKDTRWTLFRTNDVPDLPELSGQQFEERYLEYEQQYEAGSLYGRQVRVLALWKKMLEALFETGHPWLTWKDAANLRSPQDHVGVIHNSNLCTEITLNTSEDEVAVCNLGSVNLEQHLREDGSLDDSKLRDTVRILMRMLDNVIDINFYPVEAARRSNYQHRPIGLGVMGLQDVFYRKRIPFDSPDAVALNDEVLETIAYHAFTYSAEMATERGTYPSYSGSKWERGLMPLDTLELLEKERGLPLKVNRESRHDWDTLRKVIRERGMRNSNCLAIAPTATISNIMGCCPCIEPTYKNIHTKSNLSGEFVHTNSHLIQALIDEGLWDDDMRNDLKYFDGSVQQIERIPDHLKRVYKTAFEIEPTWILQCAAVRQKWIDQAQSTNLWLADNDARKASFMYREAWQRGLKTTYYLRTLNQSSIDNERSDQRKGHTDQTTQMACSIEAMRNGETCEACQ